MITNVSLLVHLARIKYELRITPPPSFWRYADLYKRLNDVLKRLIQSTLFTDYVLDIDPAHQSHDGAFCIICMTESARDVHQVLDGLAHYIEHLVTNLEGSPTVAEGQAYLQRYFDAHPLCLQCGGNIDDHDVAYDSAQPFRDDHAHWYRICHRMQHTSLEQQ